jgi:hypothetical protein
MEHRHHPRIPVGLEMLIYRRGMPVATGRIRDASRGGVFVETSYAELREYQRLEFEFSFTGCACANPRHRVAAHVRRCAGEGIALEIDESDHGAAHAMGTLLGKDAVASPLPLRRAQAR